MCRVVLPQALRIAIPPAGSPLAAATFRHFRVYRTAAVIDLAFSYPASLGVSWLEQRPRIGPRARIEVKPGGRGGDGRVSQAETGVIRIPRL